MIIGVMGEEKSKRDSSRYDAVFNAEDVPFTREAILRIEPHVPTLRGLSQERRALWVFCPLCDRSTKVTPYSLAGDPQPRRAASGINAEAALQEMRTSRRGARARCNCWRSQNMKPLIVLDWIGAIGGAVGALMLALKVSWSGWAYPVLLIFTGVMLVVALLRRRWPYVTLFVAFTCINVVGIYRWLVAA